MNCLPVSLLVSDDPLRQSFRIFGNVYDGKRGVVRCTTSLCRVGAIPDGVDPELSRGDAPRCDLIGQFEPEATAGPIFVLLVTLMRICWICSCNKKNLGNIEIWNIVISH